MLVDCQAIVLAGQKMGEADTLLTLLTLERGVLKGVAKGARRMKSRFGGSIQPFTYGQAILFERRAAGLCSVNHFDPLHSFQRLRNDLDVLTNAAVMANAARRLLPEEQPAGEAFALLLKGLRALEAGEEGDRQVFWYLLLLLQTAGYQPRVDRCLVGRHRATQQTDGSRWVFVPQLGGTVCRACYDDRTSGLAGPPPGFPLTAGAHALLRQALRVPEALRRRLSVGPGFVMEARGLLEACVAERGRRVIKRPIPGRPEPSSVNAERVGHV
jgi:DNA repair protein RecO (recombination protein O)